MGERLPHDLERLGDDLVAGAERVLDTRRRRRALAGRLAATGVAAVVAMTALAPSALGPAERAPADAGVLLARVPLVPALPTACDQPRGGRVALPASCRPQPPITVGHPRRW